MSKLYVFGIGGTGSRVIKSLVMLASAGVKINQDIVPIIIDPDFSNQNLTNTLECLKKYNRIHGKLTDADTRKNQFFRTKFIDVLGNGYRLELADTRDKTFEEYIGYNTMQRENQAIASILFSRENLASDMAVGFKGNPNVGSIVLNQFADSNAFTQFAQSFNQGDRIFIISSIFGGTGASGFPLLLKNLRDFGDDRPNSQLIRTAPIGAITVLPYFNVTAPADGGEINSSTFISKAKAALSYYDKNVTRNGQSALNAMYYIGDNLRDQYEYSVGGEGQNNAAHFVELASAMAIVDFANLNNDDAVLNVDGVDYYAPNATFREFGINEDANPVLFTHFGPDSRKMTCQPMTQMALLTKYIEEQIGKSLKLPWASDLGVDDSYLDSTYMKDLKEMCRTYRIWLQEMGSNVRGFKPFDWKVEDRDLFDMVDGFKAHSGFLAKKGYEAMDAGFNSTYGKIDKNFSKEEKVLEMFYLATQKLVENKFNF